MLRGVCPEPGRRTQHDIQEIAAIATQSQKGGRRGICFSYGLQPNSSTQSFQLVGVHFAQPGAYRLRAAVEPPPNTRGKVNQNVLPLPGSLSTPISPP